MGIFQQINNQPFVFPTGSTPSYPMPPLVTAANMGKGVVLIQAVVFIDAAFSGTPVFADWSYDPDSSTLTGYITYDAPEQRPGQIPTTHNAWFAETTYAANPTPQTINLYLRDIDPITSRGTVTSVQAGLD